jgi:hypothetical protein
MKVIVLGGGVNALGIVCSLGEAGFHTNCPPCALNAFFAILRRAEQICSVE